MPELNFDLSHHGDADIVPGLVDLAVNVRTGGTPGWLAARIRGSPSRRRRCARPGTTSTG
jgi:histidinol-phosphate aminotransferase